MAEQWDEWSGEMPFQGRQVEGRLGWVPEEQGFLILNMDWKLE